MVLTKAATSSIPQAPSFSTSAVALQNRPQSVQIPISSEVKERYLEVRDTATNSVVTVIEILSPVNLPLKNPEESIAINLQNILEALYEEYRIDYQQPVPSPALSPANQIWIAQLP